MSGVMSYKEMINMICKVEGRTSQVSRSNIQETLKVILELNALYPGFKQEFAIAQTKVAKKLSKRRIKQITGIIG